ncbi:DUF4381 domain-containing protein [Alteromonas sp. CYL-A6]|uniref:DUF4381 domain-containing protein n=1 Tax=Alteromonas nitratireducens TaxID=3390813 RepID=UPI0034AF679B
MQGMPQTDPLAQLNPVITPQTVSAWPLSWGWWVLIVIAVVIVAAVAIGLWRKYRMNRARRTALSLLSSVSAESQDWPARLDQLLKRTALSYFPQADAAALHGPAWQAFLLESVSARHREKIQDGLRLLAQQRYRPQVQATAFETCQTACKHWLKHARLPSPPATAKTGGTHV